MDQKTIRLDSAPETAANRPIISTLADARPTCGNVIETAEPRVRIDGQQVLSSLDDNLPGIRQLAARAMLVLALVLCVTTTWADDAKPADPTQAVLDRVKKMSFAEQQEWLSQLETRAQRVMRQTLPPEKAAAEFARTQRKLHQKTVTWTVLREVISDVESREKTLETAKTTPQAPPAEPQPQPKTAERVAAKPVVVRPPKDEPVVDADAIPAEKSLPGSVRVNVEELDARIAGCNLAFRELEVQLTEKDVAWNAEKLEPVLERLKVLVLRHGDLGMFRNAVPKDERASLTDLESPRTAIAQFSARVVEAKSRVGSPKFNGDDAKRRDESTRLDAISRAVAELGRK